MTAEELITLYLEQKDTDPKFKRQLNKGVPVKPDKVDDIPFRDHSSNIDQDVTWRSSSKAPFH